MLRNNNNSEAFAVAYRVVTSPVGRRYNGILGIGSHSDTWYTRKIKTTVDIPDYNTIGQWVPKNQHDNYSGSLGIEIGSSGGSISANVNYNESQLNVISRTNVATNHYETEFEIIGNNNYNLYSAEYFGFFTILGPVSYELMSLSLTHEITYFGSQYFGLQTRTITLSHS